MFGIHQHVKQTPYEIEHQSTRATRNLLLSVEIQLEEELASCRVLSLSCFVTSKDFLLK